MSSADNPHRFSFALEGDGLPSLGVGLSVIQVAVDPLASGVRWKLFSSQVDRPDVASAEYSALQARWQAFRSSADPELQELKLELVIGCDA